MKQAAYLIDCKKHLADFTKGFLNKGYALLSKTIPAIPCVWKASDFYDDMLNQRGILIACSDHGENDEAKQQRIIRQIGEIAAKNNIEDVCAGEMAALYKGEGAPYPVYIKDDVCFVWNISAGFDANEINAEVGILIRGLTDMRYVQYISSKYNYIKIYYPDLIVAHKMADDLIKYNGTAAQLTNMLGELRSCRRIFVLDETCMDKMKYFHGKTDIKYVFESDDALGTQCYTNKLGRLKLDASYLNFACFFGQNQRNYDDLHVIETYFSQWAAI